MTSKVQLQYVGPELREFGGTVAGEKFVVKAAKVKEERTITNEAGDEAKVVEYEPRFIRVSETVAATLMSVKHGKGSKAEPVFLKAEAEQESSEDDSRVEKAEGKDERMNAEPSSPATEIGSFPNVSGASGETVEDKATPHVYPRRNNRGG